ncbi:MAG TPA: protein-L-isoaspartate O-methyltransferase, partial [Epsilonproteobacteria bacterium]|nr:protein-L-isoaspartate O-methyltransferase [Campylobacterota bacterium]
MTKVISQKRLVDEIEKEISLSPWVREAFLTVDREAFVPHGFGQLA